MEDDFGEDLGKAAAGRRFEEKMRPVLRLMLETAGAEEVFIDGDDLWLAVGERDELIPWERVAPVRAADVRGAIRNAAVFGARQFGSRSPADPTLTVKVPPRWRVSAVMPPAADKWHVSIRHLLARAFQLEDYVSAGIMTRDQQAKITSLLDGSRNIIVSGGTRSGKTTLMGAMLRYVARQDRLLILEDTPELVIEGRNVVAWRTCPGTDLADLLKQALRHSPRRLAMGEVRGGTEALELVTAMNTGHDGTICTLHSNGRAHAKRRMLTQCRKMQPSFPMEEVDDAVHAVVQIDGYGRERRVTDIWQAPR